MIAHHTVDHVLLVVPDLNEAGDWMAANHGLDSHEGGHHPGIGTANRIVPLGDAYLELMTVVDTAAAMDHHIGRWAIDATSWPPRPSGVCLRTTNVTADAERLGLPITEGGRERPDGTVIAWRTVGTEALAGPHRLPFFIAWDLPPRAHPGRAAAQHAADPTGALTVTLSGDRSVLAAHLGDSNDGITTREGPPGVAAVTMMTRSGADIVFDGDAA